MGRKDVQEVAPPEEDPPLVKQMKVLDDKYLEFEREYEKEVQVLQRKYTAQQSVILEERRDILATGTTDGSSGTPALPSFWLKALKHHPAFENIIEKWDEPVLEYLANITTENLDPEDSSKGFKLNFVFIDNPYFQNKTLQKEYHVKEKSPYTQDLEITQIKADDIGWKSGKDVTVEKVAKKVKGGGKKPKQKKEKEEPRNSMFRSFFRNLEPGMPVQEDMNLGDFEDEDIEDDDEMMEMLMEHDHEVGSVLKDQIIPFAVRWYTGEAAPDDDDDDEDEEEEDDEDDESEEDDEVQPAKGKNPPPKNTDPKQEECKQQ